MVLNMENESQSRKRSGGHLDNDSKTQNGDSCVIPEPKRRKGARLSLSEKRSSARLIRQSGGESTKDCGDAAVSSGVEPQGSSSEETDGGKSVHSDNHLDQLPVSAKISLPHGQVDAVKEGNPSQTSPSAEMGQESGADKCAQVSVALRNGQTEERDVIPAQVNATKAENGSAEEENNKTPVQKVDTEDEWEAGDLAWARIPGYPFWPCIVGPDPQTGATFKATGGNAGGRPAAQSVHVHFYGDGGSHCWVTTKNMLPISKKAQAMANQKSSAKKPMTLLTKAKLENAMREMDAVISDDRSIRLVKYIQEYNVDIPDPFNITERTSSPTPGTSKNSPVRPKSGPSKSTAKRNSHQVRKSTDSPTSSNDIEVKRGPSRNQKKSTLRQSACEHKCQQNGVCEAKYEVGKLSPYGIPQMQLLLEAAEPVLVERKPHQKQESKLPVGLFEVFSKRHGKRFFRDFTIELPSHERKELLTGFWKCLDPALQSGYVMFPTVKSGFAVWNHRQSVAVVCKTKPTTKLKRINNDDKTENDSE